MIHSQLHFETILGQGAWAAHDPGIVDEYVQLILFLFETNGIRLIDEKLRIVSDRLAQLTRQQTCVWTRGMTSQVHDRKLSRFSFPI